MYTMTAQRLCTYVVYRVWLVYLGEAVVTTMILRVVMSEKVLYVASLGGLMCNKYGFAVTL